MLERRVKVGWEQASKTPRIARSVIKPAKFFIAARRVRVIPHWKMIVSVSLLLSRVGGIQALIQEFRTQTCTCITPNICIS